MSEASALRTGSANAALPQRIGATLIDLMILAAPYFVLASFAPIVSDALPVYVLLVSPYHLLFENFMNGQSPGKRLHRIRVVVPGTNEGRIEWETAPAAAERTGRHQTEWILLTSGTTGPPKMVVHTLSSLAGAIKGGMTLAGPAIWGTFYDIRRYGGLQIFLRALLGGASMVLSSAEESTGDFLNRAGAHGVTHISGTPSHWRRTLMSPAAQRIAPQYVRLSGEIADQAILDHLKASYPQARIAHAFASTEAGVAFAVGDGLAGFPASLIGQQGADIEMKVEDGSLRIRSTRTAVRYLGDHGETLAGSDGFVDTGDMVELRADRYYFVGRRGGIINVGGLKVHPEEVEAVINCHPKVRMSLVRTRKNPITGALVVADVVLKTDLDSADGRGVELEREILQVCREALPRHKVPAAISFVPALAVAETGKVVRHNA